jgi:ribose transport system substrate-binding protein
MKIRMQQAARRGWWIGALLGLSVVLAACGSGSSSTSSSSTGASESTSKGVEEAEQMIDKSEKPISWSPPGPSFDASKAKGKKVFFLSISESIPAAPPDIEGAEEGFKAAGVSVTVFDGKGEPSQFIRGMELAIKGHYDAIVLQAIPVEVIAAQVAQAEAAGIPIITTSQENAGEPPNEGVFGGVDYNFDTVGELLGALVVSQGGTSANAVVINSSDIGKGAELQTEAIVNTIKKLCSSCGVKVTDVPSTEWATRLPTVTQSAVQDQSVDFVVPLYDGALTYVNPAVQAAGAEDRVSTVSFNALEAQLENLQNEDITSGDVGSPDVWYGWAMADQTLRALSGVKATPDSALPYRTFTPGNIGEVDLSEPEEAWYGTVAFGKEFEKLWGVGG